MRHLAANGLIVIIASCLTAGCFAPPQANVDAQRTSRHFEFHYEAVVHAVPESARTAYLWIPYPSDSVDQTIHEVTVEAPLSYEEVVDPRYGNRALRFVLSPGGDTQRVAMNIELTRFERIRRPGNSATAEDTIAAADPDLWLGADRRVPIDGQIRVWAEETVAGKRTPLDRARAIYDYAVTNLKYDKSGTGWGNGDIYWACDAKRGNCTDFHALFIGFNRALGIPARFEMGFPIPADRGGGEIAGYHCWAQFHLQDVGWVPVDASEANKHPNRREYFFGTHDENRLLLTVGRDLVFPGMQSEPLNYFVYPYVEVDGERFAKVERRFSYRDL